MNIALTTSLGGFFEEAVGDAVRKRQVEATEGARCYLVCLLSQFARPDAGLEETLDRPLVFLLDEALRLAGAERFRRLRALGDAALYVSGFFRDHIENRGVDTDYVARLGATAYDSAAAMLRRYGAARRGSTPALAPGERAEAHAGAADTTGRTKGAGGRVDDDNVFGELADKFSGFVAVLGEVADGVMASQARGERGLLKVYERWLRSGSPTLAAELCARGIVPARGAGGIH